MVSAFLGKGLLLSKFLVLGKDFFKSALLCRLSKAQAWGDFTPGSASLHLGLLMVAPLRGWAAFRPFEPSVQ